jgi:hypothetical protein
MWDTTFIHTLTTVQIQDYYSSIVLNHLMSPKLMLTRNKKKINHLTFNGTLTSTTC